MESPYLEGAQEALATLAPGKSPIVVMDSGVGGLPYLEACRRLLPGEAYVYLADRAGFPYGTKSKQEIEHIVVDRVSALVEGFRPKAVVIACNTASQAALAAVRVAQPLIPIVGTVPAVKPAAERTRRGVIGVMATEQALVDPYLDDLIASHAPGVTVVRAPAQALVEFVEKRFVASSPEERRAAVAGPVRRLVEAGADEIVLACTHFLHVAADIEAAARDLGGEAAREIPVTVIDSREGVSRRLREVLLERGLSRRGGPLNPGGPLSASGGQGGGGGSADGVFLLSGPPPFQDHYGDFARRYGLSGPFSLERA